MKKFIIALLTLGAVLSLAACGNSEEKIEAEQNTEQAETSPEAELMPDSMLYYGEVLEIEKNEDGSISRILMNSQADGEMLMSVGTETAFIDSGNFCPQSPELSVGERMYVFHKAVTTMSLPPQSPALAIVRNIPMDARCAMYHEIEEVSQDGEKIVITTDNGSMKIAADAETELSFYTGGTAEPSDIKAGGHMMVIYREVMNETPQSPEAHKIMIID